MYFTKEGKEISSIIKSEYRPILHRIQRIHRDSIESTRTELEYFDDFFPKLQEFYNNLQLPGLYLNCRTKRIHGKPKVTYGNGRNCEIGDYFIVVKYIHNGQVIGKKIIFYQLKRTHQASWKIDQRQLTLLKDWPSFSFGKQYDATNSFNLRPITTELGSFVLVRNVSEPWPYHSDVFGTAYDIFQTQNENQRIGRNESFKLRIRAAVAHFHLLTWEFGEPIIPNTDIADFTSAIYRYMDWHEDPPNEFDNYQNTGQKKFFWGVEITVGGEGINKKF